MEEFVWWMHNRESEEVYEYLKKEGYTKARGSLKDVDEIVGVTWEKQDLIKFQDSLLQTPGMKTKKLYAVDDDGDKMDRSVFKTNFFITFEDKNKLRTKTILPVEAELDFISLFKQGISSRMGFT